MLIVHCASGICHLRDQLFYQQLQNEIEREDGQVHHFITPLMSAFAFMSAEKGLFWDMTNWDVLHECSIIAVLY